MGSNAKIYRQKGTGRARYCSKGLCNLKEVFCMGLSKVIIPSKLKSMLLNFSSKLKDGKLKIVTNWI